MADLRGDEDEVRVLLVEDSSDFAALVERTLRRAQRGRFEVERTARLDVALARLADQAYDAMLVDLELAEVDHETTIGVADVMAHEIPVIVLTGSRDMDLPTPGVEDLGARRRLDRADLPSKILRAVRRHRRLGSGGVDPVVCRFPDG